jgi:menaquinone-dependent protoporphyrinogen oxidase
MTDILLLYATSHGHTALIARRFRDVLQAAGHSVALWPAGRLPRDFALAHYRSCLIAAPIHFGKYPREIRRFVRRHAEALNAMPSALVSVSGAAASARPDDQAEARGYIDFFVHETGWHPTVARGFAGEVAYRKYNPILRYVMKRISRKIGRPTDTSRDHDLTDWGAVNAFAEELAGTLAAPGRAVLGAGHAS